MRLLAARKAAKLSQDDLARQAGISTATISKLERGIGVSPRYDTYALLARALHVPLEYLTGEVGEQSPLQSTDQPAAPRHVHGSGRIHTAPAQPLLRGGGATLLPVYRWGSAGDPRNTESSPYPDHEEPAPPGRESVIGPRGFGVMIKGDSMSAHDLHDGDIAWVNPDRTPRPGDIVVAHVANANGDEGMVVKIWSTSGNRLVYPTAEEVVGVDLIGPVVYATRHFQPR